MAPRRRPPRKMVGNTRMDGALDAMRQLGFEEKLIRETVDELLDVYEGTQGWMFIEEASYKLLIETILGKQQSFVEEKVGLRLITRKKRILQDDARRDGVPETSSAATPTAGITEVGSSGLVAQDSVLHASDDLDSASQTNDHHHDSPPLGNLEADVKDTTASTQRGGHGKGIRVESKNVHQLMDNVKGSNDKTFVSNVENTTMRSSMVESSKTRDKLMDNVKGSDDKTFVSNVENTMVGSSMIESSKSRDMVMDDVKGSNQNAFVSNDENTNVRSSMIGSSKTRDKLMDNVEGSNDKAFVSNAENATERSSMVESSKARENLPPNRRRRPYHGWISWDSEVDLIYFPLPPLPERIEKLIGKSKASHRRRKSRWDEKPDDM